MNTVILAWAFSPPDYFEEPIPIHRDDYVMTIAEGKVEARIDAAVFDRDPSIRQRLHNALNDWFLGVQLLIHKPYKLEKSTIVRVDADGRRNFFLEPERRDSRSLPARRTCY